VAPSQSILWTAILFATSCFSVDRLCSLMRQCRVRPFHKFKLRGILGGYFVNCSYPGYCIGWIFHFR
jgi:hypothetical protein